MFLDFNENSGLILSFSVNTLVILYKSNLLSGFRASLISYHTFNNLDHIAIKILKTNVFQTLETIFIINLF